MSVEELELLRKRTLNKCLISGILIAIIIILLFLINSKMISIFIILGMLLFYGLNAKGLSTFKKEYKNRFVGETLKQLFDDVKFDFDKGFPREVIANTEMMRMGDRYSSNDYVSGKYKNVNFEQSDIHIEEESTDSEGNTTTYTLFKGQWMIFSFNKTFKANIQVVSKRFSNAKRGNFFSQTTYNKVELEDMEFNKMFKTYAVDEQDAFYILSPSLMTRLKNLVNHTSGNLLFCFINNQLQIGVQNGKDSFEPSIFKRINEEEILSSVNADLKEIIKFIDELNLDNDLFRKEV